jgi:Ran GTPase-activating protein (RanGAP) involved in mRNA processing and transport
VSASTAHRYFGKSAYKSYPSLSPPHSSFYDRYHVYAKETTIRGVVKDFPQVLLTGDKEKPPTPRVYDEFDVAMGRVEAAEAILEAKRAANLNNLGGSYFVEDRVYGIGEEIKSIEPLPVTYAAIPKLKPIAPKDTDNGMTSGEDQNDDQLNSRPNSASFLYLEACSKKNIAPWDLLTKFENPEEPTLNLRGLTMGGGFGDCVAAGLKSKSFGFLEKVDLSDNRLHGSDVAALLDGLVGKNVKYIDLSKNKIGNVGATKLVEFLNTDTGLQSGLAHKEVLEVLSVGRCEMGERGARSILGLFESCASTSKLAALDISKNGLVKTASAAIISFLSSQVALQDLDLSWNQLTGDGAKPIIDYLKEPAAKTVLQRINLEWNGIEGDFQRSITSKPPFGIVPAIISLFESRACTLQNLNLDNNKFTEDEIQTILREGQDWRYVLDAKENTTKSKLGLASKKGEETIEMLNKRDSATMTCEVLEDKPEIRMNGMRVLDEEGKEKVLEEDQTEIFVEKVVSRKELAELLEKRKQQFAVKVEEAAADDGKKGKKKK